jgi:hypothetical protein
MPATWEAIEQQNELLRAMRAAPPGSPPEDSMGDIIQKAANAITVKDYPRPHAYSGCGRVQGLSQIMK